MQHFRRLLVPSVLLGAAVMMPSSAAAATGWFSHTFSASDVNKYVVVVTAQAKASDGSACTLTNYFAYPTKAACDSASKKQQDYFSTPVTSFRVIDNCTQLKKQEYQYSLPLPLCQSESSFWKSTDASGGTASSGSGSSSYTYKRTLPASAVGQYSLEISATSKEGSKQCILLGAKTYSSQSACQADVQTSLDLYKSDPNVQNAHVVDNCGKITKTDYTYGPYTSPVCSSSISALGLKTLTPGAPGTKTLTPGDKSTGGDSGSGAEGGGAVTLKNPLKFDSLSELVTALLEAVVTLGAILLTFMLVWVGFLFVTAQGNPEKVSTAKSALLWTVIGGLILLGAEAIAKVIEATTNSIIS